MPFNFLRLCVVHISASCMGVPSNKLTKFLSYVELYFWYPNISFSCFNLQVPPTLRFIMDGEMPNYLLAKDLILQVS